MISFKFLLTLSFLAAVSIISARAQFVFVNFGVGQSVGYNAYAFAGFELGTGSSGSSLPNVPFSLQESYAGVNVDLSGTGSYSSSLITGSITEDSNVLALSYTNGYVTGDYYAEYNYTFQVGQDVTGTLNFEASTPQGITNEATLYDYNTSSQLTSLSASGSATVNFTPGSTYVLDVLSTSPGDGSDYGWGGLSAAGLSFSLEAAPEPSTYAMMIGGFALLAFCVRRRLA